MLYANLFLLGSAIVNTNTNVIKSSLLKKELLDNVYVNFNYSYYRDDNYILKTGNIVSSDYQYHICLDNKEIISDNETVWEYDKINKEVIISNLKDKNSNILGSIKHFIQLIDHNLKVIKSSRMNNQIVFNLYPNKKKKSEDNNFLNIKEVIIIYNEKKKVIDEVNIIQNTNNNDYYKNNVIKITFTSYDKLTFNKKEMIKKYFTFQPSENIEVIDIR